MIALLAGAATVLAFAPVGAFPLSLASFALLIHLWIGATPRRCFKTGFLFGLGLFGAGVSWIYVSLQQFGGMAPALAAIATLLFCAFLALFPAAAGWLQARVPGGERWRAGFLIPSSWVLFEWLRGWIFTGFPWLAAGYASAGWPPQGYAPLVGVFGVSFICVSLSGVIWLVARRRSRMLAGACLLAILGVGESLRHVSWTTAEGAPTTVALLQGNIRQEAKFQPETYQRILDTYARLAEQSTAKLIVMPETAVPRFLDRVDPAYVARLDAVARRNGGDLLLGAPLRDSAGAYYNSVVSLGSSPRQIYRKQHLVPFGEFIPWGFAWTLKMMQIPLADFARGASDQPPLSVAGQRVAVNVCYEDAFGDEIARAAMRASLLVNVSNVAWFGDSLAPAQHLQIARLRAIETGRMHLAATNTGITAAIDRDGRVLERLPQFAEGRLELSAQGYSGITPYVRWGDWPALAAALLALTGATLIARRKLSR